jgi:hypothetical protein
VYALKINFFEKYRINKVKLNSYSLNITFKRKKSKKKNKKSILILIIFRLIAKENLFDKKIFYFLYIIQY